MKTLLFTMMAAMTAAPLLAEEVDKAAMAAEAARVLAENDAQQQAAQKVEEGAVKEAVLNLAKAPMMFVGLKKTGDGAYTFFWGDKEYDEAAFRAVLASFSEANGGDNLAMQIFYNMDEITDEAAQAFGPLFHDCGFTAIGFIAIPAVSVDETFSNLKQQPVINAKLP